MFTQLVVAVVVLCLSRLLWRRWKYDLHRVPSPPELPLLGHTWDIIFGKHKQRVQYLRKNFKLLGNPKLMRVSFMGVPMLYVRDMEFIRNVMMSKSRPFPRYDKAGTILLPLFGNDLTAKAMFRQSNLNPYQKAIRKIVATVMQAQNLTKVTPDILRCIDAMMDNIEKCRKGGLVDLKDLLTKMTLDVIGILAFETNMGGLDGSRQIHRLFGEVKLITMDNFTNPLLSLYCKLIPWSKEAQRRKHKIQSLKDEYVKLVQFFQERDDPPEGETPIWYALKTMIDPETGAPLQHNGLVAEVASVVFAGMDTTGQQLGWIVMLLASYPTVTEKLMEELKGQGLYGAGSHEVTFDDVGHLPYLTAVIKEGMRIAYIIAVSAPRSVPEDMDIFGYRIPKGTLIATPGTRAVNREEEWGDPDVFRPERWLTGEDMSDKYNLAFSVGPRDCIGQKLAMLEMRLTIVKLVTRYELKVDGHWQDILNNAKDGIIMESTNGVWFQITPRQDVKSN